MDPLRLTAIALVLLASAACESNVTAPTSLPVEGQWVGTYTTTSCVGGVDFRACSRTPSVGNFTLEVPVSTSTSRGQLAIDVPSPNVQSSGSLIPMVPVEIISNSQSVTGEVQLRASALLHQSVCGADSVSLDWRSVVSSQSMAGSVTIVSQGWYPGFCLAQSFTVVGTLTATSRAVERR
jgi:hypothetical protein